VTAVLLPRLLIRIVGWLVWPLMFPGLGYKVRQPYLARPRDFVQNCTLIRENHGKLHDLFETSDIENNKNEDC
jgi:hypothetical protein